MKYRVLIVLMLFIAFLFGPSLARSFFEKKPVQDVPVSLSAEKLTQLVNEWRVKQGLQPYKENEALCRISESRVLEVSNGFTHERFLDTYKNYPSYVSENLSRADSEPSAIYGWEGSKSHKEALLKPYKYSCISTKDNFAVQIFSNCENGCP